MELIAVTKGEFIQYKNIESITDEGEAIKLDAPGSSFLEILYNDHLIASSRVIHIEKRCFITDEVFLITNNDKRIHVDVNSDIFKQIAKEEELPFQ